MATKLITASAVIDLWRGWDEAAATGLFQTVIGKGMLNAMDRDSASTYRAEPSGPSHYPACRFCPLGLSGYQTEPIRDKVMLVMFDYEDRGCVADLSNLQFSQQDVVKYSVHGIAHVVHRYPSKPDYSACFNELIPTGGLIGVCFQQIRDTLYDLATGVEDAPTLRGQLGIWKWRVANGLVA